MYKRLITLFLLALLSAGPSCAQATITVTLNGGAATTYAIASSGGIYFSGDTMKIATVSAAVGTENVLLSAIADVRLASSASIATTPSASLQITPNPTTGRFTLQRLSDGTHQLTLFSIEGKILMQADCRNGQTFDDAHLPQGIYMVRVDSLTHKLIKL